MLVQNSSFVLIIGQIFDHDYISIDKDGLVTNNQLFESSILIVSFAQKHIGIIDIQVVLPHGKLFNLTWVKYWELHEEKSYNSLASIG